MTPKTETTSESILKNRLSLWAEFLLLFLGVPLVLALALDPQQMRYVLIGSALLGAFLLAITPSFRWVSLIEGRVSWTGFFVLGFVTLIVSVILCMLLLPERLFLILTEMPLLVPILAIGYPIILVLPQELIFRPLFFERYGKLFRSETQAIWINAGLFSFAHLMYWHWVVFLLTFVGSFIFTRSYLRGSFPEAIAYHSIAGLMIFMSGLGWLFYSGGNVAQP